LAVRPEPSGRAGPPTDVPTVEGTATGRDGIGSVRTDSGGHAVGRYIVPKP
jgi:hypothetical protein